MFNRRGFAFSSALGLCMILLACGNGTKTLGVGGGSGTSGTSGTSGLGGTSSAQNHFVSGVGSC